MIRSDDERTAHYKSEWHRYNVKRRCAGLSAIPLSLFESQLSALQNKKKAEAEVATKQFCATCNKNFATLTAYQAHLSSKKHLKRQENKDKNKGNADDEEDEDIDDETEEQNTQANNNPSADSTTTPASASTSSAPASAAKEQKVSVENDMEDQEDEGVEEEGEPIPLKTCLFCPKSFGTIENSLDHMLKYHGFFIPFAEHLTDLEGLLTYLGEKVGIGHICLYCNGRGKLRYKSTHALQQHMNAKSHCKLRLDDEEDEEEIVPFYDFPGEGEEEEETEAMDDNKEDGTNKVIKTGRRPTGMNDAGELVLSDGSIVGHRQHNKAYRQNLRPVRPAQQGLIQGADGSASSSTSSSLVPIIQQYKQMQLYSYGKNDASSTALPRFMKKAKEHYMSRQQKKHYLSVGLHNNFQHHFRAQVLF